jgi:hypothetical protein
LILVQVRETQESGTIGPDGIGEVLVDRSANEIAVRDVVINNSGLIVTSHGKDR